jgi:hypothetical protein
LWFVFVFFLPFQHLILFFLSHVLVDEQIGRSSTVGKEVLEEEMY